MNNQNDYRITTQMELINPEVAKLYLQTNTMNRKINENTLLRYAKDMINDNWSVTSQTISFATDGTLIDGQHRLNAIIKANKSIWFNVSRNVPKDSFIDYDKNRVRNINDVFFINKIPNNTHITAGIQTYNWLERGKLFLLYPINPLKNAKTNRLSINERLSNAEILDIYNSNPAYYQNLVSNAMRVYKPLKFFTISHYFAFSCYLNNVCGYDLEFILDFFLQLSTNENVKNKSITNLREIYILDSINKKTKMIPAIKVIYLIKCWNAYVNNAEIKRYQFLDGEDLPEFQKNNF